MTSDAYADVTPHGDSAALPDATTAPELAADLPLDVNPADALEQQTSVLPAEAAHTALPSSLPDDVNPADALDQAIAVGDVDDDR